MTQKAKGDGGSVAQKRRTVPLADTDRARKNSSTPVASDTTTVKGVERIHIFSKYTHLSGIHLVPGIVCDTHYVDRGKS